MRLYANVLADPPDPIALQAAEYARRQETDTVVVFGGASSMDLAKLISVFAAGD